MIKEQSYPTSQKSSWVWNFVWENKIKYWVCFIFLHKFFTIWCGIKGDIKGGINVLKIKNKKISKKLYQGDAL